MTEQSSYERLLSRLDIEAKDKERLCLPNSLQWAVEDLIKDGSLLAKIDFEKIRKLRRQQLSRDSDTSWRIRNALQDNQNGLAERLHAEAEEEIIEAVVQEVKRATGISITWSRQTFSGDDIDNIQNTLLINRSVGILLTPGHAEPLFPQPSSHILSEKLNKRSGTYPERGNVLLLTLS